MRIRLLNYDANVEYLPGKYMHIADYLSRNYIDTGNTEEDQSFSELVLSINVSDERIEQFKIETSQDPTLKIIVDYCKNGWPNHKTKLPDKVKFYFNLRNDIILENEMLFLVDRIMIPQSMKMQMLKQLHESHMGFTKTKARARELFYWVNMNTDIENFISKCFICQKYSNANTREPMIPHSIPDLPFQKLACDIFDFNGCSFLVVIDYYSKWIEFKKLKNKSTSEVVKVWLEVFSRFGVPRVIIADNVPFNSFECRNVANRWDFKIINSSPLYPKSNGLAERAVQIIKNIFKKATSEEEVFVALMEYRSTPIKDMNLSPAQLLMNKRIRTKLPINKSLLNPKIDTNAHHQLSKKSQNCKKYYDRCAKRRPNFKEGQSIMIKDNKQWKKGTVLKPFGTPRSYVVADESGKEYRRNSSFIKPYPGINLDTNQVNRELNNTNYSHTRSGIMYH